MKPRPRECYIRARLLDGPLGDPAGELFVGLNDAGEVPSTIVRPAPGLYCWYRHVGHDGGLQLFRCDELIEWGAEDFDVLRQAQTEREVFADKDLEDWDQ